MNRMRISACLSSKSVEWATPREFFNNLNEEFWNGKSNVAGEVEGISQTGQIILDARMTFGYTLNQFRHHVVNCPECSGKTILLDMFGGLKLTCSED